MLSDFLLGLAGSRGEYALVDYGRVRHRTLKNDQGQPACPIEAEAHKAGYTGPSILSAGARLGLRSAETMAFMDAADDPEPPSGQTVDRALHHRIRAVLVGLCNPAPVPETV